MARATRTPHEPAINPHSGASNRLTRSLPPVNGHAQSPERIIVDEFRALLYTALATIERAMPLMIEVTYTDGTHDRRLIPFAAMIALAMRGHTNTAISRLVSEEELTDLERKILAGIRAADKPTMISALASRLKHPGGSNFRGAVTHLKGLGLIIHDEAKDTYWPADKPLPVAA